MSDNRITITLPCDGEWLAFAQQVIGSYSAQVGFSQSLETMVTLSVMEALEELLQRLQSLASSPVEANRQFWMVTLDLNYKGEAVVVDMGYDKALPLHPHETGDWDVPDSLDDLDDLDMDTLWLHLIKKRMDRVCFMIRGDRRVLRMVKYRRDEGKEKQAWIMAVIPCLRPDLIYHLDDPKAQSPSALVQLPGKGVLRLGPSETFLVRNMDGQTSFHDLYMAHVDAMGLVSPVALVRLYEQLEKMGMLAEEAPEPKGFWQRFKGWINPDIVVPASDLIVTRVYGLTRQLFTRTGAALLGVAGLSGLIPLMTSYKELAEQTAGLEQALATQPLLLLMVYGLTLAHVACHELGHGTACKHFGGIVPRMGIMFYLASFIFYCDTTASLNFPEKRMRLLVSLAGPLVSFAILGMGLWTTMFCLGSGLAPAMTAFCLITAFGLAMNFNPFIKMDAYYMLSDLTGISNLREKSFGFIKGKLMRYLGKTPEKTDSLESGKEPVFWIYGLGGGMVTGFFLVFPLVRLFYFLRGESASGGILILAGFLMVLVCLRLGHLAFDRIRAMRHQAFKIQ